MSKDQSSTSQPNGVKLRSGAQLCGPKRHSHGYRIEALEEIIMIHRSQTLNELNTIKKYQQSLDIWVSFLWVATMFFGIVCFFHK